MNLSRHGARISPTRRTTNEEVHGHSSLENFNDPAYSDSSIEIIEGNSFAEKNLNPKDTHEMMKKSKPIHPFFQEQRGREFSLSSAHSKSNGTNMAKHDETLVSTGSTTLRVDHAVKGTSRRKIKQKKTGGVDINQNGICISESSTTMAVARSSGTAPDGCKKTKSNTDFKDSLMPTYSFADYYVPSPALIYIQCEDEANRLVQTLASPLGFDLEWRVLWNSGAQERRTALIQLCDKSTILLVQVSHMKRFPQKVWEVIESPSIIKTGANILNDGEKLYRDFGIAARGLVELGALAHFADDGFSTVYKRRVVSLAKMTAMYLRCNLVKSKERTSNWERDLNEKMVHYAANDAHAALMIHLKVLDLAKAGRKEMDPTKYTSSINPPRVGGNKVIAPHVPPPSNGTNFQIAPEPPRPQYMRAYNLWHHRKIPLDKMCNLLKTGGRVDPLKESTVISYVVGAIQADTSLQFDMCKLLELVRMEAGSWQRHRAWLMDAERSGRGQQRQDDDLHIT